MPILAKLVGLENLNKYYLEQALYVYSTEKPAGYFEKSKRINEILNQLVKAEIEAGLYSEHIDMSKQDYIELFS